jgi:hypothetical protein
MKRLFLEIEENEKNRILEMHKNHSNIKKDDTINEQATREFFKELAAGIRSVPGKVANAILEIPSLAKRGFTNVKQVFANWAKLSVKERGDVIKSLFKNLTGKQKDTLGQIIVSNEKFIKKYLKATEQDTIAALKSSGKYTDDEITSLIKGHKMNTTGSFTGEWKGYGRSKGSYGGRFFGGSKVTERIKELTPEGVVFGKLNPSKREKIIQTAITDVAKSGTKISFKDFINSMKKELLVGSGIASLIITAGIWNSLKDANVEGLPPLDEVEGNDLVTTPESGNTNKNNKLGDRVLRRGSKGSDVESLQVKLVHYGYDLGNFGPNKNGVDGKYGDKTVTAVKEFQKDAGIKVDGLFGPESLKALNNFNMDMDDTKSDKDTPDGSQLDNNFDNMV